MIVRRMNVRPAQYAALSWFVLALLILGPVCLFSVWQAPTFTHLPKASSDGPIYENLAYHLAEGDGFLFDLSDRGWQEPYARSADAQAYKSYMRAEPVSMPMTGRPPLLPAIIAVVYQTVGRGPTGFATVRVINALCLALAGALAVANVIMVLGDQRSCKLFVQLGCCGAIALAASNRTLLSYAQDFLTEPLALLLTQLLVTCLLARQPPLCATVTARDPVDQAGAELGRQRQISNVLMLVAMAFTLAGMILVRSLFVLWIPWVWGLLLRSAAGCMRSRLTESTAIIGLTLVLIAPWWVRNCVVLQRVMPLGTQGPITLLGGYSDEALANGGDWQPEPELQLRASLRTSPAYLALSSDVQRELMVADEARRLVRAWIVTHFLDLPQMFARRVVTHWNPYFGRSLLWKVLIAVGALRLIFSFRSQAWILVGLPLMNTVLVALLYTTGGRFLVPLYGVLFTLAAVGITSLLEFSFGRGGKQVS